MEVFQETFVASRKGIHIVVKESEVIYYLSIHHAIHFALAPRSCISSRERALQIVRRF